MKNWKKWKFKIFWEFEDIFFPKSQNFKISKIFIFFQKSQIFKISKIWKFSKISKFQNLKNLKKSQNFKISKFLKIFEKNLKIEISTFFFFWPTFFFFFFQISKIFLGQISRKNYFGHPLISKMSIFGFWHLWNDGFFNIALEPI